MTGRLRAIWIAVRASYWFIPSVLTILAFLGGLGTLWIDRVTGTDWLEQFGVELARPEGARSQLTVIASAMIAIASTVFAITIAAVVYASGNYGPRLLNNFMNDRGNQVSLGVFIATFVFNLTVLRAVQSAERLALAGISPAEAAQGYVPQVSLLVSAASVLLAVGVLVYFLHHVPASIRINTVLGGIGRRLLRDIDARFPDPGSADAAAPPAPGLPLTADRTGYVEIVDFAGLDRIASAHGLRLALAIRTGDFLHPPRPVLHILSGDVDGATAARLRECFSLGNSRTPTQDLEYLMDELVEIASRALSPGVNDPFTAVTSMHWMTAALAMLAGRDLTRGPEQDSYDPARVQPIADDFAHFLRRSFGELRPSAAANPIAAKMFVEALAAILPAAAGPARRETLIGEARRFGAQVACALDGPARTDVLGRLRALAPDASPATD
jgi:uncharacterized membrane protein